MEKYVHYGCKVFDKDLFINITNMLLSTKPYGGFWLQGQMQHLDGKTGVHQRTIENVCRRIVLHLH